MIVFDIQCGNGHVFEGWFADSRAFDDQVESGDLACPICGDLRVEKALMAPNVGVAGRTRGADAPGKETRPLALAKQKEHAGRALAMMRAVREHVEQNFENVGPKFADEARKIHYGDVEKRSIYGAATHAEARELREEGIEFGELPVMPDLDG